MSTPSTAPADEPAGVPAAAPVNSYDLVPYSVHAFPQTHPDRLATIATLFGLQPAPPASCRVLELGCGRGGNLIPMALAAPEARFVGIDLSRRQIQDARAVASELGLKNLDLRDVSIMDVGDDFGTFDYILTHGVYSWVPPEVQEKILQICRRNLSPQGVAYVSYNTFPGWHARGAVREMMCYHTERFSDPADRVREARALLEFLTRSVSSGDGGYGALVRQELALLKTTPDYYLLHEHLEDYNQPLYFHQFAGRAASAGLQYLGEAQVGTMVAGRFGPETEKTLRLISPDLLHMEQYMDFLRNRMFRQTLLCHAGLKLDHALRPEAVMGFHIASPMKPVTADATAIASGSMEFKGKGGLTLTTQDALMKAAMLHLARKWPMPVPFDLLLETARKQSGAQVADGRDLATRLLNCYVSGLLEFSMSPPSFVVEVSERPVASPYARLRAAQGPMVVNMRLESVELGGPSRQLLAHLDGRHDRAALNELVGTWLKSASQDVGRAPEFVAEALPALARLALLIG